MLMDVERRKWEEREFRFVDQSDKVKKRIVSHVFV